jgi:multiple sugar transport system permease protein
MRSIRFHLPALAITLLFLLPLAWMLIASLRPTATPPPRDLLGSLQAMSFQGLKNYLRIFQIIPLGRYFFNSLIVAALGVPLTLLTASWAGFAMSQLARRARLWLLILSVGLLMIPITALWLTRFVLFSWLGLTDSYIPLLAPALMGTSPLFVLLFYWNFRRLPRELFESARLDGATPLMNWRFIALPLARPTLLAVGMLSFLFYWNDFITPLLYLKSQRLYTLSIGLQHLQEMDKTNWPLLMAASVIMTLPALLVFLAAQRYFLSEGLLKAETGG